MLQAARQAYQPVIPHLLKELLALQLKQEGVPASSDSLKSLFPKTLGFAQMGFEKGKRSQKKPLRVGVLFSGGQAAGGHNVISGLFDALETLSDEVHLEGFLGGPSGLISGKSVPIAKEKLKKYRNQGGFDLLGSGRTKIETEEQLSQSLKTVTELKLDGLVIIGGDDSNTTAGILAEYFLEKNCKTKVLGVPKTIDGDLQHSCVPISFGFDTACKTYSEIIGNIARDALSARKYYHFIKLMGRSASHVALECALQTHPNLTFLGEEIAFHQLSLQAIAKRIADLIVLRSEKGKNFGVILIPEGLIEFVPEMKLLIQELNQLLSQSALDVPALKMRLSAPSKACFEALPDAIQHQLIAERDPHGNVNVSLIETEKLLIHLVQEHLKKESTYKGSFHPIAHFLGYEGRSAYPSNFDANYCYTLGMTAALLLFHGKTGYMVCVPNLSDNPEKWIVGGIPLTTLFHLEMRKGKMKPVIQKTLVNVQGSLYRHFVDAQKTWELEDDYQFPGPIQFFGDPLLTDSIPLSIQRKERV